MQRWPMPTAPSPIWRIFADHESNTGNQRGRRSRRGDQTVPRASGGPGWAGPLQIRRAAFRSSGATVYTRQWCPGRCAGAWRGCLWRFGPEIEPRHPRTCFEPGSKHAAAAAPLMPLVTKRRIQQGPCEAMAEHACVSVSVVGLIRAAAPASGLERWWRLQRWNRRAIWSRWGR